MLTDTTFTCRGRDLCTMKFLMYGPSLGCSISHLYREGELFRNRKDARSRKGVVGRTGRKMPRMPKPNDMIPNTAIRYFIPSSIYATKIVKKSTRASADFCGSPC